METTLQRDDQLRALLRTCCFLFAARIQARQLDGTFVGFGTRIRKERLPVFRVSAGQVHLQQVVNLLGQLTPALDVVVIAHVHELGSLILQRLHECRMTMPEADNADAAEEVEVFLALIVPQTHALAPHELDRLAAERVHDIGFFKFLLLFKSHRLLRSIESQPKKSISSC